MFPSLRIGIAATMLAAAQMASAGISTAGVSISNITLSASGGEWWYWAPSKVDWAPISAGTAAGLATLPLPDSSTVWHGNAASSSVVNGGASAHAYLMPTVADQLNGLSASADATADDGQNAWSFANVFGGNLMVGGGVTFTVTATIDHIFATGTMAQANAYIGFCTTDFTTDVCDAANYVEAFVDAGSGPYTGPTTLRMSWTNPGATTWAKMNFGLTASADEPFTATVPEAGTLPLLAAGLLMMAALRRRQR